MRRLCSAGGLLQLQLQKPCFACISRGTVLAALVSCARSLPMYADCLKLLLGASADPRSSWKGTSALEIARQKGHTECVRALEAALRCLKGEQSNPNAFNTLSLRINSTHPGASWCRPSAPYVAARLLIDSPRAEKVNLHRNQYTSSMTGI